MGDQTSGGDTDVSLRRPISTGINSSESIDESAVLIEIYNIAINPTSQLEAVG
jgi:hypothetical protein